MSGLAIDTLRLRSASSGSPPDPRALLAAVEPRSGDRRVLIVRRLTVALDAPEEAKEQLEAVRRRAARPAVGPVPAGAEAVEFADEAEVLLCLSRDLLSGVASQRWWWAGRLPSLCSSTGDALAVLWIRHARWVPAVLTALAQDGAHHERHAVTELGGAADAVLEAVAREFAAQPRLTSALATEAGPRTSREVAPTEPVDRGDDTTATGAGDALLALAAAVTGSPRPARSLPPAAAILPSDPPASPAAGHAPATPRQTTPPPAPATEAGGERTVLGGDVRTLVQDHPDQPGSEVTDLERERVRRRGDSAAPPPPDDQGDGAWGHGVGDEGSGIHRLPTWAGSGPAIDSEIATMLYAVNLVRWFGLDELAEPTATAWGVVEALGRLLLRDLPSAQRRALEEDPLLGLLADLDGRRDRRPTEVTLGAASRPVRRWLATHHVKAATFASPGRILVSRTHVDVVLPLERVDLAARASGLDQDPGWVPSLARIVLFHFEE